MSELSRRKLLATGGALGALGALGTASPAMAWTWSPGGSVLGTGTGADPRWVWDEVADQLVGSLLERGEVPRVNELLRQWTKNAQELPEGLPPELRDFIEEARRLPAWADQGKLDLAYTFNEKRGLYLGVLYGMASGMMSTVIPKEARAVYHSYGGSDMKDRITKTAKLGYDIGTPKAFQPDGEMIVTCVKTRLTHAGVRNLLPQSPHWSDVAPEDIPISQADMMVTWHSLATTVNRKMVEWGVPIPPEESEAYLHSWQMSAHMLGIADEYIPASWDEANAQADQVLTPILAPTAEGVNLADILMDFGKEIDGSILSRPVIGALTRFMLGDQVAEWLMIPEEPIWDPLLANLWDPFIAVREGLLDVFPGTQQAYWAFDEVLRQAVLLFLSRGDYPISISIPTGNRPS
ncbi:oxygenase MpaB family protein [Saccharopolyspora sp. NFXS83]|uniref:oxygenase MpaB family protein n=1 Tax=Saccharopolyspora sp. NFXS83 TaxID=2993560 RepID=UPI00224A9AF0|nr:oxygenase MpaB family protein [Saccharopolyspora sp. NFXS83]MCX2728743.1 oxygenase MpaB family protein [Saccharopolyspora sp. NFXS83]